MIFTTHAIVGAAVANMLPSHPVIGFVAGFTSHFLLDAIPHWDYDLRSTEEDVDNFLDKKITLNKNFLFDLIKMGADSILGITMALLLFGFPNPDLSSILNSTIIWGSIGALAPDALQFVYFVWKHEPMTTLQKFHTVWVHTKIRLRNRPLLGISLQLILIVAVVAISKLIFT